MVLEAYFCSEVLYPRVCTWAWRVILIIGIIFIVYWLITPKIKER